MHDIIAEMVPWEAAHELRILTLSDFFYIWQRRALRTVWHDLFRRILTPKDEELVATPYRHGGSDAAERFFMEGMARALRNMQRSGASEFPISLYYAFKQSEVAKEGLTSPGWATFLQGLADAGYTIDGTWPVRTELAGNLKKRFNALASSIVLGGSFVLPQRRRLVFAPRLAGEFGGLSVGFLSKPDIRRSPYRKPYGHNHRTM